MPWPGSLQAEGGVGSLVLLWGDRPAACPAAPCYLAVVGLRLHQEAQWKRGAAGV